MSSEPDRPADILNPRMVSSLRDFGPTRGTLLKLVVQDFLLEAPLLLADIERAVAGGDLGAVARIAHQMKGVSGHMGATRLATSVASLETKAKAGESDGVAAELTMARTELDLALTAAMALA
jgi:HPt (histidine-containing phosphotransfer) domain-containing protein